MRARLDQIDYVVLDETLGTCCHSSYTCLQLVEHATTMLADQHARPREGSEEMAGKREHFERLYAISNFELSYSALLQARL